MVGAVVEAGDVAQAAARREVVNQLLGVEAVFLRHLFEVRIDLEQLVVVLAVPVREPDGEPLVFRTGARPSRGARRQSPGRMTSSTS